MKHFVGKMDSGYGYDNYNEYILMDNYEIIHKQIMAYMGQAIHCLPIMKI